MNITETYRIHFLPTLIIISTCLKLSVSQLSDYFYEHPSTEIYNRLIRVYLESSLTNVAGVRSLVSVGFHVSLQCPLHFETNSTDLTDERCLSRMSSHVIDQNVTKLEASTANITSEEFLG